MMKKLVSLALVCMMLAGLYVPASANTDKIYAEYTLTDNVKVADSGFSTYVVSSSYLYNNFRPGNSIPGKLGDDVYEMSNTANASGRKDMILRKQNITDTYTDGEKVHISTELMIPAGSSFADYYIGGAGISITAFTDKEGTATSTIGVSYPGREKTQYFGKIIAFDHDGRVTLFGGRIHTNMNWSFNQWYKVDVVIVMGDKPKAAIYLDGQPLSIDVDYGNGNPINHDTDATFDGIKTSSDYVNVGSRTAAGYVESGIYGISEFSVTSITPNVDGSESTVYVDNLKYKAMSATDYPVIDSTLSLAGYADGVAVERADLSAVKVNVPTWYAHQTAKVTLSVDGAEAVEDTASPYVFDLSKSERGLRHLTLTAYDANGNVIKQAVTSIAVAGNEEQTVYANDFEAAAPFNDGLLYAASSPHYNSEMKPERKTTFENVTDSLNVTKKAAKLYSQNTSEIKFGYKLATIPASGTATVSYDLYIDNDNIGALAFSRVSTGYNIIQYADGKFNTNTAWTGLKKDVSFDATFQKWQNWQWTYDYERGTVSLKIDGEYKLDKVEMQDDWKTKENSGFIVVFKNSGEETGNFVAVDNLKVTRITGVSAAEYDMYDYNNHKSWSEYTISEMHGLGLSTEKISEPAGDNSKIYVGKVMNSDGTAPLNESFGDSIIGEFSSSDAYVAQNCAIPFIYKRAQHHSNYSKMTVEYDFYLDNLNHNGIRLNLDSTAFAQFKAGSDQLYIDPWASNKTKFTITPGKWQRYKFEFDYNNGTVPYVSVYVDGTKVYYGSAGYSYEPLSLYRNSFFNWILVPAQDGTQYAQNKIAIDNIKFSFEPITPYISDISFGDSEFTDGLVKTTASSAIVKVSGITNNTSTKWYGDRADKITNVSEKISLINVTDDIAISDVSISAAADASALDVINVTISGFALESGKQYKIVLDEGLGFDICDFFQTNEPSSVVFTAVDELPAEAVADDGVAGDITVTDVRFTLNKALPIGKNSVSGYTGGTIAADKELRADVKVNNSSNEDKTFRVIIATYDGTKLTAVSVGEECKAYANAEAMIFTSGKIDITEESAPDIKVMILNDTATVAPVSKAFSIDN